MRIVMLGLNHRTAPVELREKLALEGPRLEALIGDLRGRYPALEIVVLSTCNRVEIYLARPAHEEPSVARLRSILTEHTGVGLEQLTAVTIHRENIQAMEHLFHVATGLDSMVLGEPQILGQVRQAYEQAKARQVVGPVLHKVFQQAISVARQTRSQTGIDMGRVSVGSVAVDFARQIFEHFHDKTIVGIGAGYMAKLTLKHLKALQPSKLWVVNRSPQRAIELARDLGLGTPDSPGGARSMEDLDWLLIEADIILTSTSAAEPVITAERFRPLLKQRRYRPLFIIDIAVPRDVDPMVGSLRNVYLYNVDDLHQVVSQTHQQRSAVVEQCHGMLAEAAAMCLHQIQHRDVGQLIKALRTQLHTLGQAEQQRTLRKLAANPQSAEAALAEHTHRLINKILHLPLSQMERRDPGGDVSLGFYAAALRKLFQLSPTEDGPQAELGAADQEALLADPPVAPQVDAPGSAQAEVVSSPDGPLTQTPQPRVVVSPALRFPSSARPEPAGSAARRRAEQ